MTLHRLISLAALALLLPACGDDGAPQEGEVTGEVLEGTISDAMLPLDQVRSEAPLADPSGAGRGSGDSSAARGTEPADDAEAVADDAPAAESAETEE